MDGKSTKENIQTEINSASIEFHRLIDSLTPQDFQRQSLNPGWTNGEIVAHILFGFIILIPLLGMARLWGKMPKKSSRPFAWLLNAFTIPFNWINAWGARGQGIVFTKERAGRIFERVTEILLRRAASIKDQEWQNGMYAPTRWDANFEEFMTLEKFFHYPVIHFKFHLSQISFKQE
jgi:hypothetical protein